MNKTLPPNETTSGENDPLARLITQAGPRTPPPQASEERIRTAAYDAWQQALKKNRRRRLMGWAAAAVTLIAIGIAWRARETVPAQTVAQLEQTQGDVRLNSRAVAAASTVRTGDDLRTGQQSGARLSLISKGNLRLAKGTQLRWVDYRTIALQSGAIYLDSGPQHAALTIRTPYGVVSHVGTRYQVRLTDAALEVAVRDGAVQVVTRDGQYTAAAKEQLNIDQSGRIVRTSLPSGGGEWAWVDALAPGFNIENRTLDEFLQWLCGETGYRLEYADNAAQAAARQTVLHGLNQSLAPAHALDTILPTTDFNAVYRDERLIVTRR